MKVVIVGGVAGGATAAARIRRLDEHAEFAGKIKENTGLECEVIDIADKKRLADELSQGDVLLNMTDVGMGPKEGQPPLPGGIELDPRISVMDAIYKPDEPELIRQSKQAGARAANGRAMLACQGARSFRRFTGRDMPESVFRSLF
mgnify:CR=1 FL=1